MDSIDFDVIRTAHGWLGAGHRCELVTVVRTWGSSPRPIGAMLAIRDDGRVIGSVSGGCIEDELIERVRVHGITRSVPEILTFGISADDAHRFGLPCGGTIELAVEPLSAASAMDELLSRLDRHELLARRLDLRSGQVTLSAAAPGAVQTRTGEALITIHGPRWRLFIIGAGPLSRFLAQIATGMDYAVTVCDPREEYRAEWDVPGVSLLHAMPDDVITDAALDARSAVVALTHDPKLDDLALMEALRSEAFYVGAIGSRVNNAKRRARLKYFDLTDAQIARLHAPIGLYIGSKTPAEIAISILAELTAVKNGVAAELLVTHTGALESLPNPQKARLPVRSQP
ncbi:XdhC family protein [Massilia sp. PAMC28688]|uniref:XdhC family protein n=1 Tax=Massilia sp. PAMC28688 TaxID=2861283 RepID=UPI001C63A8A5|nr:XdhC family protein [Massilia sp. PAMC28688]QYF94285.1 XdhC family protein [Massilia sp. PAMC28688]